MMSAAGVPQRVHEVSGTRTRIGPPRARGNRINE